MNEHPEQFEVGIINPSGWGNLGDAAIVNSTLHAVRTRLPAARIALLTLNPEDSARRHGVQAFTCTALSRQNYGIKPGVFWAAPGAPVPAPGASEQGARGPSVRQRVAALVGRVDLARRALRATTLVRDEAQHRLRFAKVLGSLEWVIVAGGGQVDDYWGGAMGQPYVLLRWARIAKRLGARYLVLSVGAGTLRSPLSRWFAKSALASADYRSFRDARSGELASADCADAPVVPDLAYGLPMARFRRRAPRVGERPMVGVSPIAYQDPRVWPEIDSARYRSYLTRLAQLVVRLVETGHDVQLFATDACDNDNIRDLLDILRGSGASVLGHVKTDFIGTLDELFALLSSVDIAVVSRLHGGILSHLMSLPVVALSYERKVTTLMASMGHERFCLDVDSFSADQALAACVAAVAEREGISADVLARVQTFERRVNEQYDRVFNGAGVR